MAKHTPGPWTNHSFTVQGSKGQIVADVCVKQPPHAAKIKPSEFDANAALIAAAPDLIAALKQLVADWDDVDVRVQVPNEINNDSHWDAARTAIAKATKQE